ncbi:MAG: alpha/beta fold hydrolase, partial [Chlamydiota bacterium]
MLSYRTFGNPDKQSIVFLHGFLGSRLDFTPLIKELQKDYFCLAIDLPAHGLSSYFQDTLLVTQKTIESFQIKPFLVGYSLGGRVALHLSQKTNLSLKGTIILSSHIGLTCPLQKKTRLDHDLLWAEKLTTLPPQDFLKDWYNQATFSSLHKNTKLLKRLMQQRLFTNPKELSLVLEEMSLAKQPLLDSFSSPTYFLYGEEDVKIKELYKTLLAHIPRIEIKKAGHTVHLENPKACILAIQ